MWIAILYQAALFILALFALPLLLWQRLRHQKYRESFWARLGVGFPQIVKTAEPLIWIHAVSVGETRAVLPLAVRLKKEFPQATFVISSITETGHKEAKNSLSFADHHVYLPFDASFIVKPILEKVRPDLVLVVETDLWFNFLRFSKGLGAKIALVNGKISERSFHRLQRVPFFALPLFGCIDLFCLQSEEYVNRFERLGVPKAKMQVTGNLKFDDLTVALSCQDKKDFLNALHLSEQDPVLVIGSTHDPEEELLLGVLTDVWKAAPSLKVLLVPRHPERFSRVEALLLKKNLPFQKYSQLSSSNQSYQLLLVDAMGVLRRCYQIATLALVAGSYTEKVGGHNVLEPLAYQVPVLFGPCMKGQKELAAIVLRYQAGLQVPIEALKDQLLLLLKNPSKRLELSQNGLRLLSESRGSLDRTYMSLKAVF